MSQDCLRRAAPGFASEGKYLFFINNRTSGLNEKSMQGGQGSIFWVNAKIIEELKHKEAFK